MTDYASICAIDTNFLIDIVIVRDSSAKSLERLKRAIDRCDVIFVPFQALVEFIYVLENIHKKENMGKLSKVEIIDKIMAICTTPQFKIENAKVLQRALELYRSHKIGDAIIAATLLSNGISAILSNDKHFKKIDGIVAL